ncbi:MAG: chromosome segregation protein SMC [Candidatus Aenigmarchaeota archaeon]|nr:chromosome segregation protein SMC [Candidatus Aenigmarchaeota archaeon]
MVRISRIIMQGFKSFAGRTEVPLPSGLVVVTGPNGSGKSNILDSITFVLGVTSARHIRAQKLQGLIFKGSRKRKPSEYCEVVVEIDNSDGKIPEYDNEVRILRRITRSGISVYKINGKTANKSKVLDVLSYAGLSAEGHNIIMQGDITRIIEMNPQERRQIIDEISGIEEFNIKKEEALRRLEKSEMRVNEALVVVAEKEKRTEQLKREKEAAELYIELNKNLRRSMASSFKRRSEDALEKIKQLDEESNVMIKEMHGAEMELKKAEDLLLKAEKEFREVSDHILESKDAEAIRKTERIRGEIARKEDRVDFLEAQLKQTSLRDAELHLPVDATRFSSTLHIPAEYTTAFSVAIGGHSHDLIVQTADDAVKGIMHLRKSRQGRARFLPLDKIQIKTRREIQEREGFIGWALDLIKYDQKWYKAVSYVLGNVMVFDNIKNAKVVAGRGIKAVTLEGDLIEPSGAMVGGWRRPVHPVHGEAGIREEISRFYSEIETQKKQLAELESIEQKTETMSSELLKKREDVSSALTEIRLKRNESAEKKFSLQSRLTRIEVEKAKHETDVKDVKERAREFADVKEFVDAPLETLQKTVGELTARIRALGPINMRAIEEYKTVAVEYEQMKQRLEKLLEEKNSVVKTIEEVESKTRERFLSTLGEISGGFARIYKDMMGGEADLRLEEENNIDGGLIIEAQPEGKGKIELDSMSGGERTMTSLAFLFSIMQRYASPIYILDEIDAALDKVNTQKVARLLKKYSQQVQFLVISHNDITISAADKVYGAAMEEGVTKIFGVSLPGR